MLVENASLRESLSVIQSEFAGLLKEQHGHNKPMIGKEGEGEGFGGLSSGHFQMPYEIVRDGECDCRVGDGLSFLVVLVQCVNHPHTTYMYTMCCRH